MSRWHAPDAALRDWADGRASTATSASIEAHLIACGDCRGHLASIYAGGDGTQPTVDLAQAWAGVRDAVEPLPLSSFAHFLTRLGMRESDARIAAAAPAMAPAWAASIVAVLATTAAVSSWRGSLLLFVLVAPLLPMLCVAAAYSTEADPSFELTLAAPISGLRMLLLRSAAVLMVCVPVAVVAGIPLDGPWWISIAWLVPALMFVALVLAASTFAAPEYAAGILASTWVVAVAVVHWRGEPFGLFTATTVAVMLGVAASSGLVFAMRARQIGVLGRNW
jgi:hypothetical protein